MEHWTAPNYAYLLGMLTLTGIATYTDLKTGKIPNWLTLPFFALGWLYQVWAFGWGNPGLLNGLYGFLLGFGTYFVLWVIAGGGGGDVKLMGALSVWMGFQITLFVMILSTAIVAIDLLFAMLTTVARSGIRGVKKQYFSKENVDADGRPTTDKGTARRKRMLRFALPLAMSVWLILLADATVLKGHHLFP